MSVVSRALNNSGYVDRDKKQRILDIAKELGYSTSSLAMALQHQKTRQLVFYCKDLHHAFNISMYFGMLDEAKKRGYSVLINGDIHFENVRQIVADGIILQDEFLAREYASYCGRTYLLPVVAASFGDMEKLPVFIPSVTWDLFDSMEYGIEYLRKRGHRRIAYASHHIFQDKNSRTSSWENMMKSTLGSDIEQYFLCTGDRDGAISRIRQRVLQWDKEEEYFESGRRSAEILLERNLDATAVICYNDEFALGFVTKLQSVGWKIPRDVSILSFDGTIRRKMIYPEITCISPNPIDMGEKLVELLVDRIEGKRTRHCIKHGIHVVEGASVQPI